MTGPLQPPTPEQLLAKALPQGTPDERKLRLAAIKSASDKKYLARLATGRHATDYVPQSKAVVRHNHYMRNRLQLIEASKQYRNLRRLAGTLAAPVVQNEVVFYNAADIVEFVPDYDMTWN